MTKPWTIRIENASGMDISGKNYNVKANTIKQAILKAMMKDMRLWDNIKEAKELMKDSEKLNKNTWIYGGDVISVEVTK